MNTLTELYSDLQNQQSKLDARNRAKTIYAICRSITPQFYKHTPEQMTAALNTIQLLTQDIREDILTAMCDLAVQAYPKDRAADENVFFDVNYILRFYKKAWEVAHPQGFNVVCSRERRSDGVYLFGWCSADDLDIDGRCAKEGAPIWYEEV